MLFILVMDVLNLLVQRASEEGFLQPLSTRNMQHRISLYADDTVLFLSPTAPDISVVMDILHLFGSASGLRTNIQKSSVFPIYCGEEKVNCLQLPCNISDFPCKYLDLPLSPKKLSRDQVQAIVDRVASLLPEWKAELMTRAGRAIHVQFVMTAKMIYAALALDLPVWAIKAIDKLRKGFLWRGRKEFCGGHCLLAWPKVTRPKELGGLGISELKSLCWALRACWPWLQKTDPSRPWADFPTHVCKVVQNLIAATVITKLGDGANTLFWKDRWLDGRCIKDITPAMFDMVPLRLANNRLVKDALPNFHWISDVNGAISVRVIVEFLELCEVLDAVVLQPAIRDRHIWKFSASGDYTTSSAYKALFLGSVQFEPAERVWKSWAPRKCKFFIWLVEHNRCWTADRLRKRGLDRPEQCPLCDQEAETINHLLVKCVFAKQFWFDFLSLGLQELCPAHEDSFESWWKSSSSRASDLMRKGFNSLVILGAWTIWKHRNRCVFDGCNPSLVTTLRVAREEAVLWSLIGAKAPSFLQVDELLA
jgi:hypothetical protein